MIKARFAEHASANKIKEEGIFLFKDFVAPWQIEFERFTPVRQCMNRYAYGHLKVNCKEKKSRCSECCSSHSAGHHQCLEATHKPGSPGYQGKDHTQKRPHSAPCTEKEQPPRPRSRSRLLGDPEGGPNSPPPCPTRKPSEAASHIQALDTQLEQISPYTPTTPATPAPTPDTSVRPKQQQATAKPASSKSHTPAPPQAVDQAPSAELATQALQKHPAPTIPTAPL
nr:putative uncharacterized protein DDB_G0290521 [Penaeus vannamei]